MAKNSEKVSNKAKKSLAQQLFFNSQFTQKEIAAFVHVTEKTMSEWADKNGWHEQKAAMQVTSQRVVQGLYAELLEIDQSIKLKAEGQRYADSKLADARMKLVKTIQALQKDVMLPQYVQVMIAFTDFIKEVDLEKAKELIPLVTDFLNTSAIKLSN